MAHEHYHHDDYVAGDSAAVASWMLAMIAVVIAVVLAVALLVWAPWHTSTNTGGTSGGTSSGQQAQPNNNQGSSDSSKPDVNISGNDVNVGDNSAPNPGQ